jgi:hypothetical protein
MTRAGFMLFAWGDSASPEALGAALVAARCVRAMHLDMNSGHSGMEFYNVLAPDEPREDAGKRTPFRTEGSLPELPGFTLRARKAVTSMGLPLPRYIHPDPRDYFYLTLKPGLMASALPAGAPTFSSKDLPHAGWPPAFARHVENSLRILRIDPARALPSQAEPAGGQLVLAELRGNEHDPQPTDLALYRAPAALGDKFAVGVPLQGTEVLWRGPQLVADSTATAAIGVDPKGLLVYAELEDAKPGALLAALQGMGVTQALALARDVRLGLRFNEAILAVDGRTRMREAKVLLRFLASSTPATEVLFPNNAPIPYARWAGLQDQRVRYFRTTEPTSRAPEAALSAGGK